MRHFGLTFRFFTLLILGFLTACSEDGSNQQSNELAPKEDVSVRLKWFAYAVHAGTYYAKDAGTCSAEGINLDIHEGGPQVDATKLVAAGSNDFGIASGDQLLIARSRGLPLVAFAAMMQETPAGFMVHADSEIYSWSDFPGHKIRIIPGHNSDIELRAVMAKLGIEKGAFEEVVNFTQLQLFLERKIDIEPIYFNNQPPLVESMDIPFRTFSPRDEGIRPYGNIYFTTEKMIAERPDLVQRFLKCIIQGWNGAYKNRQQAIDALLKYAPSLDREIELKKLDLTQPLMSRPDGKLGWMEPERWEETARVLMPSGIIKEDIDVTKAYTTQFIEKHYTNQ